MEENKSKPTTNDLDLINIFKLALVKLNKSSVNLINGKNSISGSIEINSDYIKFSLNDLKIPSFYIYPTKINFGSIFEEITSEQYTAFYKILNIIDNNLNRKIDLKNLYQLQLITSNEFIIKTGEMDHIDIKL